ncbi:MAG: hypothetical protein AB7O66_12505 [Limisphaerales bacterium]
MNRHIAAFQARFLNATFGLLAAALVGCLAGCSSSGSKASGTDAPREAARTGGESGGNARKYLATDGRTIEIGASVAADGGRRFNNPHMEKGKCWVADGFQFTGYDTLYLAPTLSTAKFNEKNEEEVKVHALARERLVTMTEEYCRNLGLFTHVVTREADIPPGTKALKLENTIVEFTKGGGAARYFVGLYGGGQPVLRVQGVMTDADRKVFSYEARRSGVSAGARVGGVFMKDEDIQIQDIRSLVLDLTDFMAALSGKYPPAP